MAATLVCRLESRFSRPVLLKSLGILRCVPAISFRLDSPSCPLLLQESQSSSDGCRNATRQSIRMSRPTPACRSLVRNRRLLRLASCRKNTYRNVPQFPPRISAPLPAPPHSQQEHGRINPAWHARYPLVASFPRGGGGFVHLKFHCPAQYCKQTTPDPPPSRPAGQVVSLSADPARRRQPVSGHERHYSSVYAQRRRVCGSHDAGDDVSGHWQLCRQAQ